MPRVRKSISQSSGIAYIVTLLLGGLALVVAIYLPGISGPFVFDDSSNLLANDYVKLKSIDSRSLYDVAFSMNAGPLQRPIAMLSFAFNHYFAGGFQNSTPFKLTNLAIHLVNTVLVFAFVSLLLRRLGNIYPDKWSWLTVDSRAPILALGIAVLWAVAPIQLTSVLYVVQRMVSLSALFTLLALTGYLWVRLRLSHGQSRYAWLVGLGGLFCWVAGLLTKENAVLLPLYVLVTELVLFSGEKPWNFYATLTARKKRVLLGGIAIVTAAALIAFVLYAATGYGFRPFTMIERAMTQCRVLWLYILLIFIPNTKLLGLNHDDVIISTSLLSPLTTLPAMLGIVALLVCGLATMRRYPLLSFGILWFFFGHALESTIVPLEIMHEHRNYLPAIGVFLVFVHGLNELSSHMKGASRAWLLLPLLTLTFAAATTARSAQWSDPFTFATYEVLHHPESPAANVFLAGVQSRLGMHTDALESLRRASKLDEKEAIFHINMHLVMSRAGMPISAEDDGETIRRMTVRPISGSSWLALQSIDACLESTCQSMAPIVEHWAKRVLANTCPTTHDHSFFLYLLGHSLYVQNNFDEAVPALLESHEKDHAYLHPLFIIAEIHLRNRDVAKAAEIAAKLRAANAKTPYNRNLDIAGLERKIQVTKELIAVVPEKNTR